MSGEDLQFDPRLAARVAARYAAHEFTALASWEYHDDELAEVLLADDNFVCTMKYVAGLVDKSYRFKKNMQTYVDVTGAYGPSAVVGRIMGEWLGGATTVDQEMWQW